MVGKPHKFRGTSGQRTIRDLNTRKATTAVNHGKGIFCDDGAREGGREGTCTVFYTECPTRTYY